MPFISITRLRVKSIFYLPVFMMTNAAATKQLLVSKGFVKGKELMDKGLTFWTLTMWQDDSCMKQFRNSDAHKKAIRKLPYWCSEGSYFHWLQDDTNFPDWQSASAKLLQEGKITKVRKPSARQLAKDFPPIKWAKTERNFMPATNK